MAVRPQHKNDGSIVERRLRPIYDWLDNGNNKKALQEAEKVLKKSPSLQAAKALRALALFRLGKPVEALSALEALAEEKPSDDTTLQAMTITYRESQQLHKVCAIYENAVKAEPTNEELHSHLFMSYVRVGDYKSQQRAAMALYKFAPKNPYYFWAVMSFVLQAKAAEDESTRNILLTLAQKMIDKFIKENKMEAEQEAKLYIMILELQEKWEDILKFIESPLYSKLVPGTISQAIIPYLRKLGLWRKLNLVCKELLLDNQDRWDYFTPYLDSVFELMKDSKKESNEDSNDSADDTPEKCHEFICQLVESMSERTLRGPYIARLELWKRLSKDGDPTELIGSAIDLCVQYLRLFAHKPCAVPDLRPYLPMIPQKLREERCRDFLTCLGFDENSEPKTVDDIQRHVSCLQAWRLAAPPGPAREALRLARGLRARYLRARAAGLAPATATEFCAADGYGVFAAHHYFYAAIAQENPRPLTEAACLLELVLEGSPANFHAKLLLVTLYHLLGNALAADGAYQRLELKHVQLVSLGWLHAARLAPGAAPGRALQLLADTAAFRAHHARDSVEHLTYAYKFGTFEKLVELAGWAGRLARCGWCARAARDRATLALLAGPAPPPAPPLAPPYTDNRDLNVIVNYNPPQFIDETLKERTHDQDIAYLQLKDAIVSAISLCVELSENKSAEEKRQLYEQLKTCVSAYGDAMKMSRDKYNKKEKIKCISAPFPSRIIALVNSPVPYRELYATVFELVGELAVGNGPTVHQLCSDLMETLHRADTEVRGEVEKLTGDWHERERLEILTNYLEYIGVISYLLGVCNEIVSTTKTKKSKKKTHQSPDEIRSSELLAQLNDTVQKTIAGMEDIFENWPKINFETSLEEEFSKLNIDTKYQSCLSNVEVKLRNGQIDMLTDVLNILKKKSKFLKSLFQ